MHSSEAVMPIPVEPYDDESGIGYCLRAISANGANLHGLRRLVEIDNIGRFTVRHAPALARLFQTSSQWFERALPTAEKSSSPQRDWYGHRWFYRNHLRPLNPQVCVECLHMKGYCRAIWDVTLATVCVEHKCFLVDACAQCAKPLRWDRLRIDVGHCKHVLKQARSPEVPHEMLEFQAVLDDLFNHSNSPSRLVGKFFHPSMCELSLCGVLTVVVAFGVMTKPYEPIHSTIRSKTFSSQQWGKVVLRAIPRIRMLFDDSIESNILAPFVLESLLENMANRHDSGNDQMFAIRVLERLFERKIQAKFGSKLASLSQLKLF